MRDDHLDVGGERNRFDVESEAIDMENVILDPRTDRQLVHDAARHADPIMFRLLATECSAPSGASFPAERLNEESHGSLQSSAAAQSASGWNG